MAIEDIQHKVYGHMKILETRMRGFPVFLGPTGSQSLCGLPLIAVGALTEHFARTLEIQTVVGSSNKNTVVHVRPLVYKGDCDNSQWRKEVFHCVHTLCVLIEGRETLASVMLAALEMMLLGELPPSQ